jgi:hypothetical protein
VPANAYTLPLDCATALDKNGERVLLFPDAWTLRYFEEKNPEVHMSRYPYAYLAKKRPGTDDRYGNAFARKGMLHAAG